MLWVKSFHLIFMVTWFAGLFYLPRLFVYHVMSDDAASQARFKIMERKLYYGIATPGGLLTVGCGLWLWLGYGLGSGSGWLRLRLGLTFGHHLRIGCSAERSESGETGERGCGLRECHEIPSLRSLIA